MRTLAKVSIVMLSLALVMPQAAMAGPQVDATSNQTFLPIIAYQSSPGEQNQSPRSVQSIAISADAQSQTESFWTAELYSAAIPLDIVQVEQDVAAAALSEVEGPDGDVGFFLGREPDVDSLELARALYAEEWAALEAMERNDTASAAGADGYSANPAFVSYYVNKNSKLQKDYPFRAIGRIYFRIPGLSGTYSCTGSVATNRAVWTAGHCLYTPGRGWHQNVTFVPAQRGTTKPYGTFTARNAAVLTGWVQNNLAYDIGMLIVNDNSGRKVSQWVGNLGFMYNASDAYIWHLFGYPQNLGNNGNYLITCVATKVRRDGLSGPDPIGTGCDMTNGSSGGPWLAGFAPFVAGNVNFVNGINSYGYSNQPNVMYGPYFDSGARNLYNWGATQ